MLEDRGQRYTCTDQIGQTGCGRVMALADLQLRQRFGRATTQGHVDCCGVPANLPIAALLEPPCSPRGASLALALRSLGLALAHVDRVQAILRQAALCRPDAPQHVFNGVGDGPADFVFKELERPQLAQLAELDREGPREVRVMDYLTQTKKKSVCGKCPFLADDAAEGASSIGLPAC